MLLLCNHLAVPCVILVARCRINLCSGSLITFGIVCWVTIACVFMITSIFLPSKHDYASTINYFHTCDDILLKCSHLVPCTILVPFSYPSILFQKMRWCPMYHFGTIECIWFPSRNRKDKHKKIFKFSLQLWLLCQLSKNQQSKIWAQTVKIRLHTKTHTTQTQLTLIPKSI